MGPSRSGSLALLFHGLLCWLVCFCSASHVACGDPAESNRIRQENATLEDYLFRAGVKLDCYFTIEEMPGGKDGVGNWISSHRVPWGEDPASIDQLLERLAEGVKGVHFRRSDENPAVIHVIDARLDKARGYALDRHLDMDFSGTPEGLIGRLHCRFAQALHRREVFAFSGFIIPSDDTTPLRVVARNATVRRVLTDFIPLSQQGRILWSSASSKIDGKFDTEVYFPGGFSVPGRTLLPGPISFRERVEGLDWGTAEPVVNGVIPFTSGQVAYDNNPDPDKEQLRVNLDKLAAIFIDERLRADNPLQVRWAMLYLGKRKAESGIPVLLEHLDYRYTTCGVLEESYPAVRALTMIGRPAADAALKELLDKDETDLRVRLLGAVVGAVNGRPSARDLIARALADPKDETRKRRLELALKLLKEDE